MFSERFLSKKVILYFVMLFLFLFSSNLISQVRDFEQFYSTIERPVADMKFSSFSGVSEYGLLLALPGSNGGLAYFTNQDSLNVFSVATNIGAVSITPDETNNRIFCAFGCGSNGDGLFEFDLETQEFERINWCFYPRFVKKLSSGFYFGYGYNLEGGLLHSTNGDNWDSIDFFSDKNLTDIDENGEGTNFLAVDNIIYMENNTGYSSFEAILEINDIYVRNHPYDNEVYIACGNGTDSDAVYRVEYNNDEITSLTFINYFASPQKIYEYSNYLVVGGNSEYINLSLIEPVENGNIIEFGQELDINDVHCFEFYPIYTHNFLVGTDQGIYLATNITSAEDQMIEVIDSNNLSNYPNPFNPITTINYDIKNSGYVNMKVYNVKGQLVDTLVNQEVNAGKHSVVWNANNFSSGPYFYQISVDGDNIQTKRAILLK